MGTSLTGNGGKAYGHTCLPFDKTLDQSKRGEKSTDTPPLPHAESLMVLARFSRIQLPRTPQKLWELVHGRLEVWQLGNWTPRKAIEVEAGPGRRLARPVRRPPEQNG